MKPRIVICGQKPRRHADIERSIAGRAKVRFYYDGNLHQLQELAAHADRVFLTVGGVNHKAMDGVRKSAPGRLQIVPGGATQLLDAVERYLTTTEGGTT